MPIESKSNIVMTVGDIVWFFDAIIKTSSTTGEVKDTWIGNFRRNGCRLDDELVPEHIKEMAFKKLGR